MHDRNATVAERQSFSEILEKLPTKESEQNADEDFCPAFGFLRGIHDKALAVEFRLKNGNRETYPYTWLGPVRFNPSVGLLIKFTGDVVTLVLIRGSNLDMEVPHKSINLTDRGLHRHRIIWVREMDEEELRKTGEREPTIDRIEIADFESQEDLQEWLKKNAAEFMRG